MSKKQLLTESEMRRFARLANIPALGKELVSEMAMPMEADEDPAAAAGDADMGDADMGGADMGGAEGGETVEVGGDVDPEKKSAFEAAVQALADSMGIEVEMDGGGGGEGEEMEVDDAEEESDEESEEDSEGGEEMQEGEEGEEMQEAKESDEDEDEEEKEKKDESRKLSEDELVEAVLSRVTARLVAEAKKKKMSVKDKMKMKAKQKKEDKKEKMEEATDAKGGGPLLSKGGNKHDTYKGHADMKMGKGEKGGSGGHDMETVSAKAEHTVTHGGTNLATKGGNKKK